MTNQIAIIGGGINGLVAANYLARGGARVTIYELRDKIGGACVSETVDIKGTKYDIPLGATVLGFMQDFVFEETGLSACLETSAPNHPKIVYYPNQDDPINIYRNPAALQQELSSKCKERGDICQFRQDESRVVSYLQDGYRKALTPSLSHARSILGPELTKRFIEGSARDLLNHYFTAEKTKTYVGMTVIESGPVSLDSPFSAFNIPLLDSGSVFDGYWGFVKGGIWRVTEELKRINEEMGIRINTSTCIDSTEQLDEDIIILATDPITAARITGTKLSRKDYLGTSGKLTLLFRKRVEWKHKPELETAFRFIFLNSSVAEMERSAQQVVIKKSDYEPGYIQLYPDGAAMRQFGLLEPFERVIAFVKNLSPRNTGKELEQVHHYLKNTVLGQIANPQDLVSTFFMTPRDLKERFLFPEGNIDHTMLTAGQNFCHRHFSSDPVNNFYQFGSQENIYYCGAGAYPCGSIAGTNGYMCAQQILRKL